MKCVEGTGEEARKESAKYSAIRILGGQRSLPNKWLVNDLDFNEQVTPAITNSCVSGIFFIDRSSAKLEVFTFAARALGEKHRHLWPRDGISRGI